MLITSVGQGAFGTLMAPFAEHVLRGSSEAYGVIMGAQAIGGILGGAIVAVLGPRVPAARLLIAGAVTFGLVDLGIALYPLGYVAVWPAAIGMIAAGLPGALVLAGLLTLFQQNTQDAYRGRVFGALGAVEGVTVLAGTLGAGYLSRPLGIVPVLAVQGAGYVLAGAGLLLWLRAPRETAAPAGNHVVGQEPPAVMRKDKLKA